MEKKRLSIQMSETPGKLNSLLLAGEPLSDEGQSVMTKWVNDLWKPSLEYGLTIEAIANLVQIVSLLKIEALTDEIITFLSGQKRKDFLTGTYGPALVSSLKETCSILKPRLKRVRLRSILKFVARRLSLKEPAGRIKVDMTAGANYLMLHKK